MSRAHLVFYNTAYSLTQASNIHHMDMPCYNALAIISQIIYNESADTEVCWECPCKDGSRQITSPLMHAQQLTAVVEASSARGHDVALKIARDKLTEIKAKKAGV